MKKSALPIAIVALVIIVVGAMFITMPPPHISIRAEALFHLGPLSITNSVFTAWVATIFIFILFFLGTRNMSLKPGALQNFLEFLVENLYKLTEGVAGQKWVSKFFVVPATIFVFVLMSNLIGLFIAIPLTGFGVCEPHKAAAVEMTHGDEVAHVEEAAADGEGHYTTPGCNPGDKLVPFFRAPSADLNFTFALALITQIVAWSFGFMALGAGGYMGKFFVFDKIRNAKSGGDYALGVIDFFVGLLELLSEFVKIIAFSFRLFGNIFAGEVMLLVIAFLVPLLVVVPLIGFEIFVAFIQAFVFFILSVAFYKVAITGHGDHDEAH